MAQPFVSVVVPVLNGALSIGDCLTSLLRADYPEERREIIVVDNGSTDRTAAVIRRHPVAYLLEPRRGPAIARNRGIAASRGAILAFTDADCLATTGWLREIVRGFDDERVGGVAGEILPFPPSTPAEHYAARLRHLSPERYLRRPIFPFAVTANLAFRRTVFDRIGGFDPASPRGGESTDFCTRFFRQTGMRLHFAAKAAVFHRHRRTAWELFCQQWGYGRGHAYLYIKYRADIPWGWRQSLTAYADVARSAALAAAAAARHVVGNATRDDLYFANFELLRKLALRCGFARESLARGYVRF
jgi:glycosyltransferase involved in cell wall biosynthesis